jgi:hypothetical protein
MNVRYRPVGTKEEQTEQTQSINQSPHNLKRKSKERNVIMMKWRKNEEGETIL